jgi:threonylcarbamoyladenosine tRNA methylthiotransferase MtaB
MAGFPGETPEEHNESLRFIQSLPFTYLHVFPYSSRPGTAATARPGPVDPLIARQRAAELRAGSASRQQAFMERQMGEVLSAITLQEVARGRCWALTSNYLKVSIPAAGFQPNRLAEVRVLGRDENGLRGEIVGALHETPDY